MENTEKLVPKLRFKKFAYENSLSWKPDFLKNISRITMGQSPSSKNYTDNPQDNILVQGNADLYEGHVVPRVYTTQITKRAEKGSIILSVRAPVGDVGRTDFDVVIGRGVAALSGSYFLYQILKRLKSTGYWRKYITGSTFESINSSDIKNAKINIPSLPEQTAIGNFFKKIDERITANEHKLEHLKQQKKGLLQKMFPKKDETVPEMRFKGFDGDWKKVQLKNTVNSELKGKAQVKELRDGTVEYLDTARLNGGLPILTDAKVDVSKNDVLILWDGSKAGKVYFGFEGVLGSTLKAYKINQNPSFIFQQLKRNQKKIYDSYRTPNIPHVQKDFLEAFHIYLTNIDEQSHIGTFFQKYDQLITAQQNKINHLKQQKQALLQQMFV